MGSLMEAITNDRIILYLLIKQTSKGYTRWNYKNFYFLKNFDNMHKAVGDHLEEGCNSRKICNVVF